MKSSISQDLLLRDHYSNMFVQRGPHPALTCHAGETLSFHDLEEWTMKTVGWLEHHGIGPGDRIAVQMTPYPESVFLYLASIFLGTTLIPLNPRYAQQETLYFIQDAEASFVALCAATGESGREVEWRIFVRPHPRKSSQRGSHAKGRPQTDSTNKGHGERITDLHLFEEHGFHLVENTTDLGSVMSSSSSGSPAPSLEGNENALLCYTSGTTGRPKGAMITHRNLYAMASSLYQAWEWNENDVLLHALPLFHVHGLLVALQGALFAGARTVLCHKFDAKGVLQRLAEGDCTLFMGVPTMYNRIIAQPRQPQSRLDHMRLFVSGSAPLSSAAFHAFRERFGHTILERYGMTEAGMVLSNPVRGKRLPGSVGVPLPGVSVRIADPETGRDMPPGDEGELLIQSPSVCQGYWNNPEATREAFLPGGWLRSGDLARQDSSGGYFIVGRLKELIIVGGFNVYPREVELVLEHHPGVREAAVFGRPDNDLGEMVCAAVVPEKNGIVDETELIRHCKNALVPYKCPKEILFVADFPRNPMGKIVKAYLSKKKQP